MHGYTHTTLKKTSGAGSFPTRRTRLALGWVLAAVHLLGIASIPSFALAQGQADLFNWADTRTVDNEVCLSCHADKNLEAKTDRGRSLNLLVEKKAFLGSFHKKLACVDCHQGGKDFSKAPHNDGNPLQTVCSDCHNAEAESYQGSVHGKRKEEGDTRVPSCSDCHGRHDMFPSTDLRSKTNKFQLYQTCGKCHNPDGVAAERSHSHERTSIEYVDSIHGKAVQKYGLLVAPTCNDCHGSHDIQSPDEKDSAVNRAGIPDTCSRCHVFPAQVFWKSVHGRLLKKGDTRAPTCIDCHSAHEISDAIRPEFSAGIDSKCGKCHEEKLKQYRETIHGKEVALGRSDVASCSDCHGNHDMLPSSESGSHTHPDNRLKTCQKCHSSANANFATYSVHAYLSDKESCPQAYWANLILGFLLIATFSAFLVHFFIWGVRSLFRYRHFSQQVRSLKEKFHADKEVYTRFGPGDRLLHGLVILSFILLFVTGMPLKLHYTGLAKYVLDLIQGPDVASFVHRLGAATLLTVIAVHLVSLVTRLIKRREQFRDKENGDFSVAAFFSVIFGPDSFLFTMQDFRDAWAYQKWMFGKAERPRFDRWTYWEKMNYHVVLLGVFIICSSGIILWFPEAVTRVLPGWWINVAHVVHSDIALLASGFILTFHYFASHLRIEKFPFDPVIFDGVTTRSELEYDRPRLWERMERNAPRPSKKTRGRLAKLSSIGLKIFVLLIGGATVLFVYWAIISRFLSAY